MIAKVHSVLAVDDDPEWLDFLTFAIGEEYPVASSNCGDDIVRRTRAIHPSVIVLDIMMQGHKDGFTAFSELQRDPVCSEIPVIMLSEVNRCTDLGFAKSDMGRYLGGTPASFLEKPISAERIRQEIRRLIAERYQNAI